MIYWKKRLQLLWRFIKLIPKAKELEEELKSIEQKVYDLNFSEQLYPKHKEKELAYLSGFRDGILFCIKRFW